MEGWTSIRTDGRDVLRAPLSIFFSQAKYIVKQTGSKTKEIYHLVFCLDISSKSHNCHKKYYMAVSKEN